MRIRIRSLAAIEVVLKPPLYYLVEENEVVLQSGDLLHILLQVWGSEQERISCVQYL
jgi:hypothetical protein